MNIIELEHVYKQFDDKVILRDFSLQVRPGETMTIIGGSGSGKSVTLKLILRLLCPDRGVVRFCGQDLATLKLDEINQLRQQIGMLFQGAALFDSLTVRDNIAYPLREHFDYPEDKITEVVESRLALVGLPGIEDMMPADLSGGMRKRVGLARAIATDPRVILYDEPTTGLDPANTQRVNRLIRELQQKLKVTSVVVTHDMDSAFAITDRLALLCNCRVEFVGTPEEAKVSKNALVRNFIEGNYDEADKMGGSL